MTEESIGHNTVAGSQLRAFIERVERLEEEKKEVAEQVKEVLAEAKASGFDTKIIRKIVRERKRPAEERDKEAAIFDLYWHAIGMAIING